MNFKILIWGRIITALAFFTFICLIFIGTRDILSALDTGTILYLQFVPSLLKFAVTLSLSALGFFVVIALTILLGRFYCSAICPLGILQDLISRTGKIFLKKSKYTYSKPYTILRNSILVLTVVTGIPGLISIINLIDPYSIFGKIATGLFRPPAFWFNNLISTVLESFNIYSVSLIDHPHSDLTILFPVFLLIIIIIMAGKYGRLYCNTICPVGTFLGWISSISLFKIHINAENCTRCGKCSFSCKSQCISILDLEVDHSRCVACFNCLSVCNDKAISFGLQRKSLFQSKSETSADLGKRAFIATSLSGIFAFSAMDKLMASGGKKPLNKKPTTIPIRKTSVPSPPGSLSVGHFTSFCTACQLCVSQCPSEVLQPSSTQFGIAGFMQVFMDYDAHYCNFECVICSVVCPTGAILPLGKEAKKTTQIGKVNFVKENCVVYTEGTACGSCSEHCPTQAVKMVPYKGNITIPETDNSICVGCGACEYVCPVRPFKAIYVDGNLIHEIAKKPVQKKLEEPRIQEEFPF